MSLLPMICLILFVLCPGSTFLDKAYSNIFLLYIRLIFFSSVKDFSQNNLDFQKRVKNADQIIMQLKAQNSDLCVMSCIMEKHLKHVSAIARVI